MAYDVSKLTKLGALKQMAERIAADYATKAEVTAAINAKVSSAYTAGGSAAFDALPELTEANVGLVVNVTNRFTTTEDFVEGAGQKHPAGTNVVVVKSGEEYKYDALSGFVDLSGCVEKEDGKGLSANDFTDADKEKLDGMESYISSAIVNATTMVSGDNTFAARYGLSLTDGAGTVKFQFPDTSVSLSILDIRTVKYVANTLTNSNAQYSLTCDASGQLIATDNETGDPVELVMYDVNTNEELHYTSAERIGPMYSFNGRSGMVVPQAGDYTPEMVGVIIAADEEVTEMLAEVFGTAE